MVFANTLTGWIDGPPPTRDDGGLAIVEVRSTVRVDGQETFSQPIIVARWSGKLKTTGSGYRLDYDDVVRFIDLALLPEGDHHV